MFQHGRKIPATYRTSGFLTAPDCCKPTGSAPSNRKVTGPSLRSVIRRRLRRSRAVNRQRASVASAASARCCEPATARALRRRRNGSPVILNYIFS